MTKETKFHRGWTSARTAEDFSSWIHPTPAVAREVMGRREFFDGRPAKIDLALVEIRRLDIDTYESSLCPWSKEALDQYLAAAWPE